MDVKLWETLYEKILEGDILDVLSFVFEYITKDDIFLNGSMKRICVSLLLLAVLAGIFTAFMESFGRTEVSKMSYFMIHILLFSILITLFLEMMEIAKDVLNAILLVMNAAIPIYYMAVVGSGHHLTAYTYYRVSILAIYVVEQLILHAILPFVSCYLILTFGNALWLGKKLSQITDFMKKVINTTLKTIVGVVSGVNFLQAMVSPSIDSLKNGAAQKVVSMLPGIGNAAEGMTELTVGSLVLIKNSVGLCMFLILVITAAIPIIKLFLAGILLRGCGALMAVISEKDFAGPVIETSEAILILLKIVLAVLLLFIVSTAIVLFTTNV